MDSINPAKSHGDIPAPVAQVDQLRHTGGNGPVYNASWSVTTSRIYDEATLIRPHAPRGGGRVKQSRNKSWITSGSDRFSGNAGNVERKYEGRSDCSGV